MLRKETSTTEKIAKAFANGGLIMLGQTPIVNALNAWSVVCGCYNLSDSSAIKFIFEGKTLKEPKRSVWNFTAGMSGHLSKETTRLLFKSTGLYVVKPWLMTQHSPAKADLYFAAGLSFAEIIINPADTWRVNIQAGVRLEKSLRRLYAGAGANGLRQFGTWWGFGYSNRKLNPLLEDKLQVSPSSLNGMALKAYPQSLFFTSMVFWLERIKNEMQFNKAPQVELKTNLLERSQYFQTAKHIVHSQGYGGLFKGFHPKVLSNSVLAFGANLLIELGQRQLRKK